MNGPTFPPEKFLLFHVGTLKEPELTMTHQNAMRFYNKIAYDTNFEGPGDSMEEGKRLGGVLGNKEVMFMGNHGIMTVGNSVALTFDALYYLERVAMFQVSSTAVVIKFLNGFTFSLERCFDTQL